MEAGIVDTCRRGLLILDRLVPDRLGEWKHGWKKPQNTSPYLFPVIHLCKPHLLLQRLYHLPQIAPLTGNQVFEPQSVKGLIHPNHNKQPLHMLFLPWNSQYHRIKIFFRLASWLTSELSWCKTLVFHSTLYLRLHSALMGAGGIVFEFKTSCAILMGRKVGKLSPIFMDDTSSPSPVWRLRRTAPLMGHGI